MNDGNLPNIAKETAKQLSPESYFSNERRYFINQLTKFLCSSDNKQEIVSHSLDHFQSNFNSNPLYHKTNFKISSSFECSICLSEVNEPYFLSCGHSFHKFCTFEWLKKHDNWYCPLCKRNMDHFRDFKKEILLEIKQKKQRIIAKATMLIFSILLLLYFLCRVSGIFPYLMFNSK